MAKKQTFPSFDDALAAQLDVLQETSTTLGRELEEIRSAFYEKVEQVQRVHWERRHILALLTGEDSDPYDQSPDGGLPGELEEMLDAYYNLQPKKTGFEGFTADQVILHHMAKSPLRAWKAKEILRLFKDLRLNFSDSGIRSAIDRLLDAEDGGLDRVGRGAYRIRPEEVKKWNPKHK